MDQNPNTARPFDQEIETMFTPRPVSVEQLNKVETIRTKVKELAYEIKALCPNSREKSLAMTYLQTLAFFAVESIAKEEPVEPKPEQPTEGQQA